MLATTTAVVCRVTAGATGLLSTALDYSYYTAALASTLLCRKEKRKGAYPILRLQRYTHIDPNNGIRRGPWAALPFWADTGKVRASFGFFFFFLEN